MNMNIYIYVQLKKNKKSTDLQSDRILFFRFFWYTLNPIQFNWRWYRIYNFQIGSEHTRPFWLCFFSFGFSFCWCRTILVLVFRNITYALLSRVAQFFVQASELRFEPSNSVNLIHLWRVTCQKLHAIWLQYWSCDHHNPDRSIIWHPKWDTMRVHSKISDFFFY